MASERNWATLSSVTDDKPRLIAMQAQPVTRHSPPLHSFIYRIMRARLRVLGDKSGKSLVTLGVTADESADAVSIGGLVELAGYRVDVGNRDLDTAEIIGGQDTVGP